ncbi:thiamine phosphate synthase [bacterium]|nr:thiamine phosphate synthase [bacterium]
MKPLQKSILRLIDASLNRAAEGIRVLEDTARMLFDDEALTRAVKDIRHELAQVVKSEKSLDSLLLASRGSDSDVLRSGETRSERTRDDILSIVKANAGRTEEALRTLEEYSKLLFPHLSHHFKTIRFRMYDIEQTFAIHIHKIRVFNNDNLKVFVVIDHDALYDNDAAECALATIDAGVDIIAYSDNNSSDGVFMEHASPLVVLCKENNIPVLICDRLDCALMLDADGIHIDTSDISPDRYRTVAGPGMLIGYTETFDSTDNYIIHDEADYALVKYVSREKQNYDKKNELIQQFVYRVRIPVLVYSENPDETMEIPAIQGIRGIVFKLSAGSIKEIIDNIKKLKKR